LYACRWVIKTSPIMGECSWRWPHRLGKTHNIWIIDSVDCVLSRCRSDVLQTRKGKRESELQIAHMTSKWHVRSTVCLWGNTEHDRRVFEVNWYLCSIYRPWLFFAIHLHDICNSFHFAKLLNSHQRRYIKLLTGIQTLFTFCAQRIYIILLCLSLDKCVGLFQVLISSSILKLKRNFFTCLFRHVACHLLCHQDGMHVV